MPVQEPSLWTEEQGVAIEAMRRDMQRLQQEHEAALEEHKQALLRCQDEIQTLHESIVELQQIIAKIIPSSNISLSAASSSESCSMTTNIESNPSRTSNTPQQHTKRKRVTLEPARFGDAFCTQEQSLKSPESVAILHSNILRSFNAQSHKLRSQQVYVYTSLPDYNSIRLLELVGGPDFAPLQCKLVVSRLIVDQSYQALSYAWGETAKTHHITIGGKRLPISANLDRALRRVRRTEQDLYLWVDAICINQDDAIEKEYQISLMLQIYRSARRVVVYLGEQSDHSELLPEFFDTTIRARRVFNSLDNGEEGLDHEDLNRSIGILREIGEPTSNNKMWRAARAFYDRPWIMRVWIVQEVVAANELIFLCGGWELPGTVVYDSVIASTCHPQLCPFGNFVDRRANNQVNGLMQLFRIMNARSVKLAGRTELLDLLYLTHGCKETDLRDHVFAVLGMAQEATQPSLRPNYREHWQETYLRYTECLIKAGSGLRALYRSSADSASPYKQSSQIPSWVPDFSFGAKLIRFANEHNEVHGETAAGGNDAPLLRINMALRSLTVQATKLDSIQSLSPSQVKQQISDHYAQILQWRTELEELWPATQYPPAKEMQDTICRVMLCHQEPPDLEMCRLMIWSDDSSEFDRSIDRKRLVWEIVQLSTPHRRCVTSTGLLGQVPSLAQEGDVIVIPTGSAVPFVLRPRQAQYQLIGQAYIHGVMMGEALQFNHLFKEEIELI
ncbi:heterokaryon incompatibility protein-domain-containing protein [Leptodontidium sp. MPI-SDFR-AT-0119]|nr:heterokaryon incompatibility protein-domain-containing protein [Leptodontidium sp. MPI-SDFR-AT-0119]